MSFWSYEIVNIAREKGRDLTRSYEKIPYTHRKLKVKWQHKNGTRTSITQLLRTDLGRSVWVITILKQEHVTVYRKSIEFVKGRIISIRDERIYKNALNVFQMEIKFWEEN